ncbi:hypothetical protein P389DRAFT_182182 [Cystobasidium minutum MCA 4210]|uniref:uncharacterized protein n=1 Tax=Cystobasidium minutum MCA 4210 TaxID=1397322 RepID=UPI0034CECC07|eukprot:jgi/Rhomi1/182182/fgenesh1_pg.10_\
MSNLQREVRSALRALVRAQRVTFHGDIRARQAARDLNRGLLQPAINPSSSQEEKNEAITGARQVARYLMENVLQGVPKAKSEAELAYELRFTPHTALGDNSTISKAKPAPSLEEIKATMNQGESAPKNTRKRRPRKSSSTTSEGEEAGSSPSVSA